MKITSNFPEDNECIFFPLVLFKASENGHKEVVSHLIVAGADGRIHPVTKYSPLYIGTFTIIINQMM